MTLRRIVCVCFILCVAALSRTMLLNSSPAADHNDPNAVNSIFSDIDVSAADLYDLFGWPSDDTSGGEKVVIALTFASVPKAGVLDPDMLYRIKLYANPRAAPPLKDDHSLEALLKYFEAVKEKYLHMKPGEVRVKVDQAGHAKIDFIDFPSGTFSNTIDTNKPVSVQASGATIKVFVGGRDDAFFNDLPGFFRSINYAPQFYHVPHTMTDGRELGFKGLPQSRDDPRRSPAIHEPSYRMVHGAIFLEDRLRGRARTVQARRYRRSGVRRRGLERARGRAADRRQQLLARAALRHAPRASRLGLRTFDRRAGAAHFVRPRQLAHLCPPDLRLPDSRFSTSEESYLSGGQHARQQAEQEGAEGSAAALGRDLRAQRQLHRHGHDRHLALRQAAGRS